MKELFGNKYVRVACLVELLIVLFFVVQCFLPLKEYEIPYSDMVYVNGKIVDGKGVYTDSALGTEGYFVYGPSFDIESGVYDITIAYQTDCLNNRIVISGNNQNYNSVLKDNFVLNPLLNSQKFTIWVNKEVRGFAVSVIYDGTESFLIKSINVHETLGGRIYVLIKCVFFLMLINVIAYTAWLAVNGKISRESLHEKMILGCIILFASYPLFTSFLTEGDDIVFHLLRIEGIKDGLLAGQFPVRIHPFQFRGYGYASSIFYGEILLYLPAVLRLCGFPLQTAYKIFVLCVNVATALIAYRAMLKITKDKSIAMICCMAYVLAPYRLTNIYVRCAVGEYCAMIFWPLIASGLYQLFTTDIHSKEYKKIWILLAAGYTGLIQTHILSCEIAAAVSIIICLILIKRVFRKETLVELVKFFAVTVFINAFYLVPFLDYMMQGGVLITDCGSVQTRMIQGNGIYPAQLFNLFVNGSGMAYGHAVEEYKVLGMREEMGTTVGITLLLGILLFIYLFLAFYQKIKNNSFYKMSALMSVGGILALAMSTNLFPWDSFCRNFGSLVYNLQFPWRMLSVGTIILTLLLGCVLAIGRDCLEPMQYRALISVLVLTNIITAGYMLYDRLNTSEGMYVYDATCFANKGSGSLNEYLPSETDSILLNDYEPHATNNLTMSDYEKEYTNVSFHIREEKNIQGEVKVPLLAYRGYEATDDSGNHLELGKDENAVLKVMIPAKYEGTVSIRYAGIWYWRVAEVISLISFIIFILFAIKCNTKDADIK